MRGVRTPSRASLRPSSGEDSGSMLIELMVSLVVFTVIAGGLTAVSLSIIKKTDDNRFRTVASQLLARDLETVRAAGVKGISVSTCETVDLPDVTVGGLVYDLKREVCPYAPGDGACGVGVQTSVRATTVVAWKERLVDPGTVLRENQAGVTGGQITKQISGSTVITPEEDTYTETNLSSYGVTLTDRNAKPIAGVPVTFTTGAAGTMTGTGAATKTTNSDGCALVQNLTPGTTYTAWTGSTPPQYVPQGFQYPTSATYKSVALSMVKNKVVNASWVVDKAASLTLTTNSDLAHPVPANLPYTVYNATFPNAQKRWSTTYAGSAVVNLGTPSANTFSYLFPVASGYMAWAGDCDDADPGTSSGLQAGPVILPQGGAASATVPVVKVDVTLDNITSGNSVLLTAKHKNDANCINTTNQTYYLHNSVVTGSATKTVSFALPYGAWTFTGRQGTNTTVTKDVTWTGTATGTTPQAYTMVLP